MTALTATSDALRPPLARGRAPARCGQAALGFRHRRAGRRSRWSPPRSVTPGCAVGPRRPPGCGRVWAATSRTTISGPRLLARAGAPARGRGVGRSASPARPLGRDRHPAGRVPGAGGRRRRARGGGRARLNRNGPAADTCSWPTDPRRPISCGSTSPRPSPATPHSNASGTGRLRRRSIPARSGAAGAASGSGRSGWCSSRSSAGSGGRTRRPADRAPGSAAGSTTPGGSSTPRASGRACTRPRRTSISCTPPRAAIRTCRTPRSRRIRRRDSAWG